MNAAVAEGYLEALGCTSRLGEERRRGRGAQCRGERFDLVLMDLNMPGMDGFAATALIREQREPRARASGARVPIVALTAHDAVQLSREVPAADMDDILSKPYTLEDCTRLLRRWLARATRPRRLRRSARADPAVGSRSRALASVDANAVAALRKLRAGKQADLYSKLVELFRSSSTESLARAARRRSKATICRPPRPCVTSSRPAPPTSARSCTRKQVRRARAASALAGDRARGARAERRAAGRARAAARGAAGPAPASERMSARRHPRSASRSSPTMRISAACCSAESVAAVGLESLSFADGSEALAAARCERRRDRAARRRHAGARRLRGVPAPARRRRASQRPDRDGHGARGFRCRSAARSKPAPRTSSRSR